MPRRYFAALAVALAACSSDDPGGAVSGSAAVTVSVVPSGFGPQQDYAVSIDGEATGATLGAGASRRFVVETGTRTVALTGLPAWCTADAPSREVRAAEGEEATVRFTVTCTGARVTLTTEGAALDPDGYRLVVDGDDANAAVLPASGTVTVPLVPGERQLVLSGIAPNCSTTNGSRTVPVDPMGSNALAFRVVCAGGSIRVTVTTTGRDRDFDGYVVMGSMAGFTDTARVAPASTSVLGSFPAGATVQVALSDLAPNCTATGAPFSVTVILNDPVNLAVPVTCAAAPSSAILVETGSGSERRILRYFPGGPGSAGTFQSIGTGQEPRWAPGGTGFAFFDSAQEWLMLADVDAGTFRALGHGFAPAYSPDPRRLFFLQFECPFGCYFPDAISYVDPASPTFAPADALPAPQVSAFDVSPVTGAVAYVSGNVGFGFETYELRTANADGSGVRVLLTGRNFGGLDLKPRFSPDGQELFIQRECPTGSQPCIHILRTDGSSQRVLDVRVLPLDWSPDGTRLLVVNPASGSVALSLLSASTGQVLETLVGNAPAPVRSASWRR